jgi:tape measure domain-containing protein
LDDVTVAVIPDFSQFATRLRAGVEAGLRSVAASVDASLSSVERGVGEVGRGISTDFARASTSAQGSLRAISSEATSAFNNVQRQADQASNGISARLGGALATVKTGLLTLGVATGAGLAALTGFGLKSAATLEQTQISFNSLLGSVAAGTKAFKDLQQFAAVTPFEFPEVAGAAQRFYAFSGSVGLAKDQVTGFLTTLGDVASVTGGGAQALNSVTLAMGQIASAGKVTLDNLNQISEALPGFSGVAAIASATGKTTAEVMQEISSGGLDATTGINALLKGMQAFPGAAGAMEAQGKTLLGVFSTFKDTFSQALVAGFTPVIPAIKASLNDLTPVLGSAIAKVAPALGQLVAGLLPALGQLVGAATTILGPLLAGLGEGLKAITDSGALKDLGAAFGVVAAALQPLFPVLAKVVVALAEALVPVIIQLGPIVTDLAKPLSDLITALLPLIPSLGLLAGSLVSLLPPLIVIVAAFVSFLSIKGILPLVTLLAQGIGFLALAVGEFASALSLIDWAAIGNGISGGFSDAWNSVVSFFTGVGDFFSGLPDRISAGLAALPGVLSTTAVNAFDAFFRAIGYGIGLVVGAFVALPSVLGAIVSDLWARLNAMVAFGISVFVAGVRALPGVIEAIFLDLWHRVQTAVVNGVEAAVAYVKAMPGRFIDSVKTIVGNFVTLGGHIIDGLIQGVESRIGAAIAAVKRAMGDVVDGAKNALGIHSPSMVFATEVGAQIPPGMDVGIQKAMPDLLRSLTQATASMTAPAAAGFSQASPGAALQFSITVNVAGSMSQGDAYRVGQAVGAGAADTLTKRGIVTAGRTV